MRIAFITPEFVTEHQDSGGLGNYLNRMCKLLREHGHEPEIFVSSRLGAGAFAYEGIRVERVPLRSERVGTRILIRLCALVRLTPPLLLHLRSRSLAAALERRDRQAPFDLVQSADYQAVGLCVRPAPRRVHLIRCSWAADLYNEIDNRKSRDDGWRERMERRAMRRADRVFAPSRFIADHFRSRHRIAVEVLRPPAALETGPSAEGSCGLPERFFLHFGQLIKRKGTHWLAESLKLAFEAEPALRMVWVGKGKFKEISTLLAGLGRHRSKVQALYPLTKPELYAVLQRAEAAVLPSLCDNLPNTVIESLMLGIPVIGTRGASVDELVQAGVTGELVSPGDAEGLAEALVRVWRGQSAVRKGFSWRGGIAEEMRPEVAVQNLLQLAEAARAGRKGV